MTDLSEVKTEILNTHGAEVEGVTTALLDKRSAPLLLCLVIVQCSVDPGLDQQSGKEITGTVMESCVVFVFTFVTVTLILPMTLLILFQKLAFLILLFHRLVTTQNIQFPGYGQMQLNITS
ncbi:hypothetical protein Ancab_020001 [Ancistrocladus abbreviatus]